MDCTNCINNVTLHNSKRGILTSLIGVTRVLDTNRCDITFSNIRFTFSTSSQCKLPQHKPMDCHKTHVMFRYVYKYKYYLYGEFKHS